ncbi:hypothetical protein [Sphingomonas sp. 1P08PE]|uniref:hypothetical protein n=1 Tax=Sphingomonas sp. 1P08PE TaxID=554122 RepID=UPI0039A0C53F
MSDKQPMQASGGDGHKGADDGVGDAPAKHGGGESGGGTYPNPQTGKKPTSQEFMGHGGQTEIDYSGPGGKDQKGSNANAIAKE